LLDEVGDDQEVARIVHAGDDIELERQPLAVILLRRPLREGRALSAGCSGPARPAWRNFLIFSFLGVGVGATVKRGRIGLRVIGRNAQRSAISIVEASASGMSANSTAISARVLKR